MRTLTRRGLHIPLRVRRRRYLLEKGVTTLYWVPAFCIWTSSLRCSLTFSICWNINRDLTPPLQPTTFLGAAVFPPMEKAVPGFTIHLYFQQLIDKEWANPAEYKDPGWPSVRPYALVPETMERLQSPLVDAPVAALGAPSALPADSNALPKDTKDRRVEVFAKRALRTSLGA